MGNSICDRLFISFSEGNRIDSKWSPHSQDGLGPWAYLSTEARSRMLSDVQTSVDPEMMRFYHASSAHRQKNYELDSASEMEAFLPKIDPWVSRKWSLDESETALKELRLLIKESTGSVMIVNEVNYLTHLFLLYNSYLEQKRKDELVAKSQLLKDIIKTATDELEAGTDENKKEGFMNCLIVVTLKALIELGDSIVANKDAEKFHQFSKKVMKISSAFSPEDKASPEDVSINMHLEQLARTILTILKEYRDYVSSSELNYLVSSFGKLIFYIGKMSIHLALLGVVLQDDAYEEIKISDFDSAKPPSDFSLLRVASKAPTADSKITLPPGISDEKTATLIVDQSKMLLSHGSVKAVYNRRPEFGLFPLELSGSIPNSMQYYKNGEIWACFFNEDKSEIGHGPVAVRNLKEEVDHSQLISLAAPSTLTSRWDPLLKQAEDQGGYIQAEKWYFTTSENDICCFLEWTKAESPNIYTLRKYLLKVGEKTSELQSEIGLNSQGKLKHVLGMGTKDLRVDFVGGIMLLYNSARHVAIVDPERVEWLEEKEVERPINGVDRHRSRVLTLKPGTLSHTRVESFSTFFLAPPPSALTPGQQHVAAYMKQLLMHVFGVHLGSSNLEFQAISDKQDKSKTLFQHNQVDLREQTFTACLELLQLSSAMRAGAFRDMLTVGVLRILDIHLNLAARVQNEAKAEMKTLGQETITRLRKLVLELTVSPGLAPCQLGAFDYLRLNTTSNLLALATKVKHFGRISALVASMLSARKIHSQQDISRLLSRLLKLQAKGVQSFDSVMGQFAADVRLTISQLVERESVMFKNPVSPLQTFPEAPRILGCNLIALFNAFVAFRNRIKEEVLTSIVEHSITSIESSVTNLCQYLLSTQAQLSKEQVVVELELTIFSSFTGYVLSSVITFMSYATVWPELSNKLTDICRKLCSAISTSNLQRPNARDPVPDVNFIKKTWKISAGGDVDSSTAQEFVCTLPIYNRLKLEVVGMDPIKDRIAVANIQEFDAHNQGREKKVSHQIAAPQLFLKPNCPVILDTNWIKVALFVQPCQESHDVEREITLTITGEDMALKYTTKLETLLKMCSNFIIHKLFTEIKQLEEKGDLLKDLPEPTAVSLETVLGSHLFENGFEKEKFELITKLTEGKQFLPSEMDYKETLCRFQYENILGVLGLTPREVACFDELCAKLQADSAKKSLHATILGTLGFTLVKSAFVVLLLHSDKLASLLRLFASTVPDPDAEMKRLWQGCTKLRALSRSFETDRQFLELYRKLAMLLSIEPSRYWDQDQELTSPKKVDAELNEGVFKMKIYIEELRLNNTNPTAKSSNVLVEVIIRFLGLQASVDQIIAIVEQRQKHFEIYGKGLDIILKQVRENPLNIHDALLMFNQIFRKSHSEIGFLMEDYNGLSKLAIETRIAELRELFQAIVDYILRDKEDDKPDWSSEILLAIESFKWLWRGKEIDCIRLIDINKIWNACIKHFTDKARFRTSMIDLCFVLLKFCARKAEDMKTNEEEELSLKKTVSLIDEHSMTSILNQNFNFLIQVLSENIQVFDSHKPTLTEAEYTMLSSKLPKECNDGIIFDKILEALEDHKATNVTVSDVMPITLVDRQVTIEVEYDVEEKVEIIAEAAVEEAEEANDLEGLFKERAYETKVVKKKGTEQVDSLEYKRVQEVLKRLEEAQVKYQTTIGVSLEEVRKVLLIFYFYVYAAPDMATLFFAVAENLKIVTEIAFGKYPEELSISALKILEELSKYMPTEAFMKGGDTLPTFIKRLSLVNSGLFSPTQIAHTMSSLMTNTCLQFLRKLLLNPAHSDKVARELKACINTGKSSDLLFVLEVLDHTHGELLPGTLAFDKLDLMKEQLMVLEKNPSLVTKAYMRDILYYRYDITTDKDVSSHRVDRKFLTSDKVLTICLRTKNYSFLDRRQVGKFDPIIDKEMLAIALDDLDIVKKVIGLKNNDSGLIAKFKLVKIIRQTKNAKYRSPVEEILRGLPLRGNRGISEDDCSLEVDELLDRCIRTADFKLPELLPCPATRPAAERFHALKAQLYNNLKREACASDPTRTVNSYWASQFGSASHSKKVNFNIALNRPSLNQQVTFDPSCDFPLSSISEVVVQGIQDASLNYQFTVRNEGDREKLLTDLAKRQGLLEHKNCELVEIRDIESMLDIILEECSNLEALMNMADGIMQMNFVLEEVPWKHRLLGKLIRRCKSLELSKNYVHFMFDQVCTLTQHLGNIACNNLLVNSYVQSLETVATLCRVLPKHSLELNPERTRHFDEFLACIEIPFLGDSYSFKRMHKQEYIGNIMIHFARYVMLFAALDSSLTENKEMIEFLEKNNREMAKLELDLDQNNLIKGIIMTKLLNASEEVKNVAVSVKLGGKPFAAVDLHEYSHWAVLNPGQHFFNLSLAADREGRKPLVPVWGQHSHGDDFLRMARFSVDKQTEYFVCANRGSNAYGSEDIGRLLSHAQASRQASDRLLSCISTDKSHLLLGGGLWVDPDGQGSFRQTEAGISCFAAEGSDWRAVYKPTTKQLLVQNRNNNGDIETFGRCFSIPTHSRSDFWWVFDLRDFPTLVRVGPAGSGIAAFGLDEAGGLILVDGEQVVLDATRALLSGETKQEKRIHYFRGAEKLLYFHVERNGGVVVAVFEHRGGLRIEHFKGKRSHPLVLPATSFSKAFVANGVLFVLTLDGNVFVHNLNRSPLGDKFDIEAGTINSTAQPKISAKSSVPTVKASKASGFLAKRGFIDIAQFNSGAVGLRADSAKGVFCEAIGIPIDKAEVLKDYNAPGTTSSHLFECLPGNEWMMCSGAQFDWMASAGKDNLGFDRAGGLAGYPVSVHFDAVLGSVQTLPASSWPDPVPPGPSAVVRLHRSFRHGDSSGALKLHLLDVLKKYDSSAPKPGEASNNTLYSCSFDFVFQPGSCPEPVMEVSIVGSEKSGLAELLKELGKNKHFWDSNIVTALELIPDIAALSDEEFERFKAKHKQLWEAEWEEVGRKQREYRDFVAMIVNKRMAGDENGRSAVGFLVDFRQSLSQAREYSYHFDDGRTPDSDLERLHNFVFGAQRLLNYFHMHHLMISPVFGGRHLDDTHRTKAANNVFETFDYLARCRLTEDNYNEIYLNRLKANKYVSLKRQNFSLLNQLCYEMHREAKGLRHRRTALNQTEFNFVGEGRPL